MPGNKWASFPPKLLEVIQLSPASLAIGMALCESCILGKGRELTWINEYERQPALTCVQ
jgi:hypothetical protein